MEGGFWRNKKQTYQVVQQSHFCFYIQRNGKQDFEEIFAPPFSSQDYSSQPRRGSKVTVHRQRNGNRKCGENIYNRIVFSLGEKVIVDITLSKISQSQEDKNSMFCLYKGSRAFKFPKTKKIGYRGVLGGGGNEVLVFNKYRFSVLLMRKYERSVSQ